ncbi:hypothetical protein [Nocardia sp. alder85J]|uniref:hypothetical protein n=1 Tax=Nocardia sp. alder85J TaxID=2862949 RepID=UPI001CD4EB47|nr:hypothetical protein [Nocardia sp. alder85J]MCX4098994.1 hypothetical protein [Nocardia sp. alder85J]
MATNRSVFEMVTAFLAMMVAGMSLLLPIDFPWTSGATAVQLDLLAYSLPRSIAAGCLIALIVAVFATTINHGLAAWGSASCGIVILFLNHLIGHFSNPTGSMSTVNFLDSVAGGILLGGIATAVLHGRLQVFGWTLGALGSVVVGAAAPLSAVGEVGVRTAPHTDWPAVDSIPMWLLLVTLVLVGIGTFVNRNRQGLERRTVELPLAPVVAGVLFVGVTLLVSEWLARHADSTTAIVLAVVATVLSSFVTAMLLPRRDGILVLLAVAAIAVDSAIQPPTFPHWSIWPIVAVIGVGLILGFRIPGPMTALVLLAGLAGWSAATEHSKTPIGTTVSGVLLALVVGYAFGSASPRYNPTRVLGVTIVLLPSVVLALRDHVDRDDLAAGTSDAGHWHILPVPAVDSPTPDWTALAITAGCAAGLLALRHWRAPVVYGPPPVEADTPGTSRATSASHRPKSAGR